MYRTRRTALSVAVGLATVAWSLTDVGAARATAGQVYSAPLTSAIANLPVAGENRTGYLRTLFPLWDDADGDGCDTREEVLISEADDPPTVGSGCSITGGRWFSYYDRVSWTDKSRVDIDHVVPLADAWRSGASSWTTAKRAAFANDLNHPQLIAVTDDVNSAKGDKSPDQWKPPLTSYWCTYAKMWVASKYEWDLSITSAEKSALASMLDRC